MDIREVGLVNPEQHWYYQSKFRLILETAVTAKARNLLDFGAGDGFFSTRLRQVIRGLCSVQYDPNYGEDILVHPTKERNIESLKDKRFDFVLLMDVLEHVSNPLDLLRTVVELMDQHGTIVITVPARMELWSFHDEALGHFLRYEKQEISNLVKSSGLRISRVAYELNWVYPLAWARSRLFSASGVALQQLNPLLNWLLGTLCRFDKICPWRSSRGVTLMVVAQRSQ